MEAATMEHVQAEKGLVENEVAITVVDELVNAKEGNEFHQGGEETQGILYFEGNEMGDIESNDDGITEEKPGNEKSQSSGSLSLKDRRLEVIELDVERVIEEQDTHDLYCPNCHSCITRRVILRKRKRKIRSIHYDVGGSSSDPTLPVKPVLPVPEPVPEPVQPVPEPVPQPVPEPVPEPVSETWVILIKCLSCFTYFIPAVSRDGEGDEGAPVPPARNQNWFFSCFQPPRGEKTAENVCIQADQDMDNVIYVPGLPLTTKKEKTNLSRYLDAGDDVAFDIPGGQDEYDVDPVVQGRTHEWDILKSIIYGGLIETITSLGVVSSAAAGDATSLNIVVLGLANLMSGLIIIIHNITELKKDCREATSEANSNIARYRETLGREENFRLHAIVTVMSFLVFGLLPPVTYGFSFHRSDDKLYKLITCAAASLVCIILLSIGKAHVQKPPKHYIRTILKYLFSGLSASGFCYAVGLLINRFLQNSGWFETTSVPSTIFLETRSMKSGSAFYE